MAGKESKNYANGAQDAYIDTLRADVAYIKGRVDEIYTKVAHMRGVAVGAGAAGGFVTGVLVPALVKLIFK